MSFIDLEIGPERSVISIPFQSSATFIDTE